MTVIEVKPRKWGWCVFESPGVEPVFLDKDQAIGYAETRARLRTGEIRIFDSTGKVERVMRLTTPIADCDGGRGQTRLAFRASCIPRRRKRFVVRADEKLTAFMELESAIRNGQRLAASHS